VSVLIMPWQLLHDRLPDLLPELTRVRHDIHQHPELGFEEHRTQDIVLQWMAAYDITAHAAADTGVVADLHPDRETRLALRCDLDALPIEETTDLPYRSVHDGVSHKCGHDGHTTILLGVARMLAAHRDRIDANVRLLFQPAEEGVRGGGARVMVEQGVLAGVPEVYGMHNWPGFPKGNVHVCSGPIMAQVDNITLRLRGRGGHGAQPQRCRDPIVAGAQIVTAAQTVVSRSIGALDAAVVSFGCFRAGKASNVIPPLAELSGTIRTLDPAVRAVVHRRLREVVAGVAQAMGVEADLVIDAEYPVLVNDPVCVAAVERVARARDLVVSDAGLPLLASEDFAYFAEQVPAAYFFLGAGRPGADTPGCHHPDFDFDDELIGTGISMFLGIVEERVTAR
jgi:amidohydrolase